MIEIKLLMNIDMYTDFISTYVRKNTLLVGTKFKQ